MTESTSNTKILVWDAPVRVFHWLLVLSFAGAYLTAESERWRLVHVSLGYTMAGLVAFRILWGLMGTRYARFASFVRGPAAVMRYARAMLAGQPEHHVGHNPAGALAIVLLLLSSIAIVATGWAVYNDVGGDWLGDLHEGAANIMLIVVAVHVAGVAVASWLHRENLVRAMVTGKKEGTPDTGIRRAWRPLALIIVVAVLGFWWLQWQSAPSPQTSGGDMTSDKPQYGSRGHDDDD
ncbi:MAG: cytochrome b/b6 domain-containing protein [Burkholderiaceae bacterium]|nr:cytochrome b/b6 domain-containing protein [Burkholderiaceae bacterium]